MVRRHLICLLIRWSMSLVLLMLVWWHIGSIYHFLLSIMDQNIRVVLPLLPLWLRLLILRRVLWQQLIRTGEVRLESCHLKAFFHLLSLTKEIRLDVVLLHHRPLKSWLRTFITWTLAKLLQLMFLIVVALYKIFFINDFRYILQQLLILGSI